MGLAVEACPLTTVVFDITGNPPILDATVKERMIEPG
jgi:hypothetical protein